MNRTKATFVLCFLWLALLWPAGRLLAYRDLETGTFLTRDPAGMVDGPNLYSYVRQNPWSKFDPEGLSETWRWGSWVDYTGFGTLFHASYDTGSALVDAGNGTIGLVQSFNKGVEARTQLEHSEVTPENLQNFNDQRHERINEVSHDLAAVLPVIPGTALTGPAALPESTGINTLESNVARGSASIENSALKTKALTDKEVSAALQTEKTYQTYTKANPETGEVYTGRTSGTGTPRENIAARDRNHHKTAEGFAPAVIDKSSSNADAIRGREQQMIDANGGAKSDGGTSGNAIRGIREGNQKADQYMEAAKKEFGG